MQGDGNFGDAMRYLRPDRGTALDTRMVQVLAADTTQLPPLLRRAVSLLATAEVGLDWAQLLRDLWGWNRDDVRVQRNWARSFWSEG
jgi:CRISPR type I-E-associated protein CasB/Cse2